MKTLICIVLTLTVVSALTITPAKKFSESWVMEDRGIFYGFVSLFGWLELVDTQ